MSTANVAYDTVTPMDQLYPTRELGFLEINNPPDPLIFKLSELVYRQCQKERIRQKQKNAASAYAVIVSCLFLAMMMAFVVSRYYKDLPYKSHTNFLNFATFTLQNNSFAEVSNTSLETTTQPSAISILYGLFSSNTETPKHRP